MYKLIKKQKQARRGELITRKGGVQTPCFMPVATKGALKTLSTEE
ncbi:MAG TPA: tRNA guanosine(34) transglycosylase Tgt, partial [Patescibacteria group bacterium]|nr:tRNA guanosine(34) transglycosylase Tgt [Patescibacteria group bacterium]